MSFGRKIWWAAAVLIITQLEAGCRKDVLHWGSAERITEGPSVRWNRIATSGDSLCIVAGGEKFGRADVMISRDGGQRWESQAVPALGKGVYGLAMGGGKIALAGFTGRIAESWDAGRSWQERPLPVDAYFVGASMPNATRLILISTITNVEGSILVMDSAASLLHRTDLKMGLNDLLFQNPSDGLAAGYGGILRTADSGYTWSLTDAAGDNFVSLYALDATTVYTCGYAGSVLMSTDGGKRWQTLRTGNGLAGSRYHLQDILFTDAAHGYCVGEDGLVLYTDDAGAHWAEYERFTSAHLRSIASLPGGYLLVCGDGGALWRLKVRP